MVKNYERIESIFKVLSDRIFIIDKNGLFTGFVQSANLTYLIQPDKIIGSSIFDIFSKDEASKHIAIFRKTIETGIDNVFEYSMTENGKTFFYEAVISKLNDSEVISIVRDITKRVCTETALRKNEKKFRDFVDLLPEALFEADINMIYTYANKKSFEFFGYNQDDFDKGINCLDLIIPSERETVKKNVMKKIYGESETHSEYTGLRKDGSTFPILIHSSLLFEDGKPSGIRGIVVDMTIQKKIDESVFQAQKLESIGFLAGGIAHDFNNLILGLFGSVEIAKNELENNNLEAAKNALTNSMTAFNRAKDLTHQLLTFAKGGIPNKKIGDIRKTLQEAVAFSLSGSNITSKFEIEENIPMCNFDPNQISQVIENIVINAKQAMSDRGTIFINVKSVSTGKNPNEFFYPGEYLKISIKDNGIGIPEEYRKKIFDPFFTTKKSGSGLGLATSWSIIKRHNGILDLESELGKGSTFHIYLPVSNEAINMEVEKKPEAIMNHGRILLMDDEFLIREVAGKMLSDAGFVVEKAVSGEEAVEFYMKAMETGQKFDAVILDLTVPGGMGGKETVEQLLNIDPEVVAIASSGYSEDSIIANPEEYGFSASLPKPYLKDVFANTIMEVILAKKIKV
ncbi:MAG TPA: PAS domain S-box protein [bacterium]|nr:PAS domain S-box protein [bacterium]